MSRRRVGGRAGGAALATLLALGATAGAAYADGSATVTVHDGSSCSGAVTSSVTAAFSVEVSGMSGGPLAAVAVRSDDLVVASAVAVLDDQGSGCADLPAVDPGSYRVTVSIGDVSVDTSLEVAAVPQPEPSVIDPPAPDPQPTDPAPTDPPATSSPEPQPGSTGLPAESAPADPGASQGSESGPDVPGPAAEPAAGATSLPVRSSGGPDPARPAVEPPASTTGVVPPAQVSPAPPAPAPSPSAAPNATPVAEGPARATARLVAVLASSERPAAVTIAGLVVLEVVGGALIVAAIALLVSRSPRRRG